MAEEQGQRDSEGLCSTKLKVSPGQGCLVRSQEPEEELMLTLTLPHTCRDRETALGQADTAEAAGGSHTCLVPGQSRLSARLLWAQGVWA